MSSRTLKAALAGFAFTLAATALAVAQTGDNSAGSMQSNDTVSLSENGWDFNAPNGVPGFGPLSADTDMDLLLRQATGQGPAATANPQATADIARADRTRASLR